MNAHTRLKLTKAEFRRWIEERPEYERYELVNGEPRMMVRVKRAHDMIVTNWILALGSQLDRTKFTVHTGEFAVSTNAESYRLPDVSVERAGEDGFAHEMTEPLLLVEVLSPSSIHTDMNEKLREYLAMPMLQAYAICAQDTRRVWLYRREDGVWPERPIELKDETDKVEIPGLGASIALMDLYFGVSVQAE
jgi:Uma2 family endonuclease